MAETSPPKRDLKTLKSMSRGYKLPDTAKVDRALYDQLSRSGRENEVQKLTVPKQRAIAWEIKAGQTARFVVAYGSQVGDLNLWNLHNFGERFFTGKTRQIHGSHLSTYDRLWSNFPYLRPLATITADSLSDYGIDPDGGSIHDVIGTRCDPYTAKLITGKTPERSCHTNLIEAVKPWGLKEADIHDVFNIFMVSGFTLDTHEYFIRGSPAEVGDYIEILAEEDLLLALSACPHGDVSVRVEGAEVPDDICFPLDVHIGQPSQDLIEKWEKSKLT